ncbi:SAM-dependent methyltransferase [Cellulomonas sp. JH27-2]|uniref:SAM-dependent methyltransferase n=1 Tax=Cellulomonas sp. JH27-2 TaxID=2774139 RepID=UPI001784D02E|nr:SAM-dependent methyltransferase [Cellulomonas sp. JH27-2]MBD8057593.1 SAM-dependent methyltransferase [Cellulomonas sp. JH27-2]
MDTTSVSMQLLAVGSVSSPRTDPDDTTGWGDVVARIDLVAALGTESLVGLADFSHVEVLFWFDRVVRRSDHTGTSRARGRADMPLIGVFAARGPNRPNPVGVSICRIEDVGDTWITVRGLDAVDGTPVLDLKPVMPRLLPDRVEEPGWSTLLMHDYYERD